MFNLIITIIGVALLVLGFYLMSFGFSSPPNGLLFFLGLCITVLGLILVVFFVSGIEISGRSSPIPENVSRKESKIKPRPQPVKVEKKNPMQKKKEATLDNIKKTIKSEEPIKTKEPKPRIIKPKKVYNPEEGQKSSRNGVKTEFKEEKPKIDKSPKVMKADESSSSQKKARIEIPKKPDIDRLGTIDSKKDDDYVKKRLDRLKESYIENAKDIESIIDERLDSFKGTLGKLKSDSKEPGLIWSFDAGDVQEAVMETISKTNNRLLMMYPWIRNIEVGSLKKFMETESCLIIQEASLDDDASVELLRLLMDKNVKIRTMPHVHTIAIVSDDTKGLIISTDPIYESYEVGVIYKDQKSIEEIEKLFKDAWSISQDIDLELKL